MHQAKKSKNDEFYTRLVDIENELKHYKKHFAGKVVYCNCDDPRVSQFFHYFSHAFKNFKLKKLITTCYKNQERDLFSKHDSEKAISLQYDGFKSGQSIPNPKDIGIHNLQGDGDFRSEESIALLKEADIVVTNPPFSLFREYLKQLIVHDKKFLIISNPNAITYKETFKLIKDNKIWLGHKPMGEDSLFNVSEDFAKELRATKKEGSGYKIVDGAVLARVQSTWFTNMNHSKRNAVLITYKQYTPEEYPTYDNYDAINVDKVSYIPKDYGGMIGVPITFLGKYNPDQFEIVRFRKGDDGKDLIIGGKYPYARIIIKQKK